MPEAKPVRSLWALMDTDDFDYAVNALKNREGVSDKNSVQHIWRWSKGECNPDGFSSLQAWSEACGIDAVVWTALPPKMEKERTPALNEVLSYLSELIGPKRDLAEEYVRKAPKQIDTAYRRAIEAKFGWTRIDS